MLDKIKFEVHQGWGDFKVVWMMKEELGKMWNGYMKDGNIEWQEVKDGGSTDKYTPFMKIPRWAELQGLVDALSGQVATTKETSTIAELRATKYHLEDMRKLVKGLNKE